MVPFYMPKYDYVCQVISSLSPLLQQMLSKIVASDRDRSSQQGTFVIPLYVMQMLQLVAKDRADHIGGKGLVEELEQRPPCVNASDIAVIGHGDAAVGVGGHEVAVQPFGLLQLATNRVLIHVLPPARLDNLIVIADVKNELRIGKKPLQEI
jgi:hypothetical protein